LVTDGQGLPLSVQVSEGKAHESRHVEGVLNAVRIGRRQRPKRLAGDKGYSYARVRRWLRAHHIQAVIPRRTDQQGRPGCRNDFDRQSYRRRNVIERCVGWLKGNRRLGTRYEKLAVSFLALVKLAMIQRYLRLLG
jgi:transposase